MRFLNTAGQSATFSVLTVELEKELWFSYPPLRVAQRSSSVILLS
jgi:hypothetical protein